MVVVMIHARDKGKSARRVKEIVELQSFDAITGKPRTTKSFTWIPFRDTFELLSGVSPRIFVRR